MEPGKMIPFLTVMLTDFEKDLAAVKLMLAQLEKRAHVENGYRLSERAEMAAGWWFYDIFASPEFLQGLFHIALPKEEFHSKNVKSASIRIIDLLQGQLKKSGSDARVKMHGDVPFAAPWWSWLMK